MIRLSVLDQSPIRSGGTAADAIGETVQLAQAAERLGYHRYWVAEHHSHGAFAGTSPEILIGQIASTTKTIRVGSGGVMLSHYSALKVAESFRMLETLHPGRIDLGLGRAPGADRLTSAALAPEQSGFRYDDFPQKVSDLRGWIEGSLPEDHPFARIRAMPAGETAPEMWLLGTSDQSAILAAHFGCAFSFAHFINTYGSVQVMDMYRRDFRPSPKFKAPMGSLAVFVICAPSEEEALYHAASRSLLMLRSRRGEGGGVPTPEEVLAYPWTDMERAFAHDIDSRTIAGDPEQVKKRLETLASEHKVDEFIIVNVMYSFEARVKSYELLAEVFELQGNP